MKKIAGIVAVVAMLFGLGACSSSRNEYEPVCIDQITNMRVPDSQCGNYGGGMYPGYYPVYYPVYMSAPGIGYPVTQGYVRTLPPKAHMSNARVPAAGGAVNPKAAPKPASTKKPFWSSGPKTNTPPKGGTYTQPPKSNGGAYKPPANSAPKPAAPPRPASPPKSK